MLDYMNGPIRQLEIAGQELAPFFSISRDITPFESLGKWEIRLIRREESDEAISIIQDAIRRAPDRTKIPVKKNFYNTVGEVEIDETKAQIYVVRFEDMGDDQW